MSRTFSNSTEFMMWERSWCSRCLVDAPFRDMDKGFGCQILARSMVGDEVPPEWIEQTPWEEHYPSDAYHCTSFKGKGWRNPEPKPKPAPQPGPGLFEEPPRSTRMLRPLPDPSKVCVRS